MSVRADRAVSAAPLRIRIACTMPSTSKQGLAPLRTYTALMSPGT
jgi:hypothetical protein